MTIRQAIVAIAVLALAVGPALVAAPSATSLGSDSSRSGASAAFGGGGVIVEVLFDRPMGSGRVRQERYWTKSGTGELTAIGVATIRYVDVDRDGQPDAGEIISFSIN